MSCSQPPIEVYRVESRLYTALAKGYPASASPTHHATARIALFPKGVPSNPRSVSMMGVKGWYWANQRIPTGIDSVLTKALLMNGSKTKIRARRLAPAGVLPTSPNTTLIHETAKINSAMRLSASIQLTGLVVGTKPIK
jgi:hypothetical protein